jgi:hypothetical protein
LLDCDDHILILYPGARDNIRLSLIASATSLAVAAIATPVMKRSKDLENSADSNLGFHIDAGKRNEDAEDVTISINAKKRDQAVEDLLVSIGA